ncbi:hypothetical protein OB920_12445 [Halobacteria archaeon HArc-gm2]|nr:hypothetical protein [Halobacteria archaeon HArc-gm2]
MTTLIVGAVVLTGVGAAQTATFFHDGEEITLQAGQGQAISGETNLDRGSTVNLLVQSEDPESPFLTRPAAEVDENGRFTVYVDLSHLSPGTNLSVAVSHDDEVLAETTARTVPCSGGCKPMAAIDSDGDQFTLQAGPGQEITGTTSLDSASSVTVRLESEDADQPFLVATETLVSNDGTFSTHLDLTDARPGTRFKVSVLHEGEQLTQTTGEVIPCDGGCEAPTTETASPRPTIDADELGFKSVVEASATETARIPVGLGDADAATLVVGSADVNYVVAATVRDGNGDNRVVVEFDAAAAGTDNRTISVADEADDVAVVDPEPDLGFSIEPADYDMQLYGGDSTDGEPDSTGTLILRQPTPTPTDDLTLQKDVVVTRPTEAATVPIGLGDADSAMIAMWDPDGEYGINATVSDGDGDDRVVLYFRTRNAGTDRPTLEAASAADNVSVTDPEPTLSGPLPETEYHLNLYAGADSADDAVDVGVFVVSKGESGGTRTATLQDSRSTGRDLDLGGIGALAAGAVFAVVGVGLLLGLFRS